MINRYPTYLSLVLEGAVDRMGSQYPANLSTQRPLLFLLRLLLL